MSVSKPSIANSYPIDWHISRWGRGKNAAAPEYVVVHFTGSENTSAAGVYKDWVSRESSSRANTHYLVDANGIYECVDPKAYACQYACAAKKDKAHIQFYVEANGQESPYACTHIKLAGNFNTINIEACSAKRTPVSRRPNAYMDTDFYFPDATYKNLVALVAWLLDEFGIPIANVIMHHQISGKLCPAMWCNSPDAFSGWNAFKEDVSTLLNKATTISALPAPSGSGTATGTSDSGTVRVNRGDAFYMNPGSIALGYFNASKSLKYTMSRSGYYYTPEGWVKGE